MNILISSAGRRVELINCFRGDAHALGISLRIITTDMNPSLSPACAVADASYSVPPCTDPTFGESLRSICITEKVDVVVPTIDTELPVLANLQGCLEDCFVLISSPDTIGIARDKFHTAHFFREQGIPSPQTVMLSELLKNPSSLTYPLVLKPIDGSSSVGLHFVKDYSSIQALNLNSNRYVAQPKLVGTEYTVNCYVDRSGKLLSAVPHHRIEVRGGEVSKGRTEKNEALIELATRITEALPGLRGPFCFQGMVTSSGDVFLFEMNARFGGGFPLTHRAGAPFTKWIMEEALGRDVTPLNSWESGLTMLRYDAAVFISSKQR